MKSIFEEKKEELHNIYARFVRENIVYSSQAFCKPGCSFCCTFMGISISSPLKVSSSWSIQRVSQKNFTQN